MKFYTLALKEELKKQLDLYEIALLVQKYAIPIRKLEVNFECIFTPDCSADWKNISRIVLFLPEKIVYPHLDLLIDVFMDVNWEGAEEIMAYLCLVEKKKLASAFERPVLQAVQSKDEEWAYFMLQFMTCKKFGLKEHFKELILVLECFLLGVNHDLPF